MIAVLAGGVGAARLLAGLIQVVTPHDVVAIVNTGDDAVMHGLHISPDLDTITYTLAGAVDPDRGWGLRDESWRAMGALGRFASARPPRSTAGGTWFGLGDLDLATHLYRTHRLAEGASLTAVTAEIVRAFGVGARLLPMSDAPAPTFVTIAGEGEVTFQEYFVGRHHAVAVSAVRLATTGTTPTTAVLDALNDAELIVIAPSNPIVSIGPVLSYPSIAEVLARRRADVVAVSPIVAGAALKGPADRMLVELGHEASVAGVARLYRDVASVLVIDTADADLVSAVEAHGLRAVVTPTIMSSPAAAAALARHIVEASA